MVSIPSDTSSAVAQRETNDNFDYIFPNNVAPPALKADLPHPSARIANTLQLVYCNNILARNQNLVSTDSNDLDHFNTRLEAREHAWRQRIDTLESERLRWTVEQMVKSFAEDSHKGSAAVTEIVLLGPLLDYENYRILVSCLLEKSEQSSSTDLTLLRGIVQVLECAPSAFLVDDDLVRITNVLFREFSAAENTDNDRHVYLTWVLSRILDVMVAGNVKDLNRNRNHQPALQLLVDLKNAKNSYVRRQAAHSFQALQYASGGETPLQALWKFFQSTAVGTYSPSIAFTYNPLRFVTSDSLTIFMLNPLWFVEGLQHLEKTRGGEYKDITSVIKVSRLDLVDRQDGTTVAKDAYMSKPSGIKIKGRDVIMVRQDATTIAKAANMPKERCPWYVALKGTARFVQEGRLFDFNQVVFQAPCRHNVNFQWGVCRQLGEIAIDPLWDAEIRQQAIDFLVRLYKTDTDWNPQTDTKCWILSLLHLISSQVDLSTMDHALGLLKDLKSHTTNEFPRAIPLSIRLPLPTSFPLLTRVQEIPDIEFTLHALRKRTTAEYERTLYIPPMAKASLSASDNGGLFPLMDKVQEFLASDRQVMLILGDSGVGKSTFNRQLEYVLWQKYNGDRIPLFINLPESKQPEKDLVAEQLRAHNFPEEQIQELKYHRQFILICDGYDERQLNCNLYTRNLLNRPEQWNAKLIIACRTQYLRSEYRDQFVPNTPAIYDRPATDLFQEAVIVPFSEEQIVIYTRHYVPLEPGTWVEKDYIDMLTAIPNLMDMVKTPFLLKITLEALPKVVASELNNSHGHILRAQLYDVIVVHWLQANHQELYDGFSCSDHQMPDELLDAHIFTQMGLDYSTSLATAIFQMQDGNPVVQYSHIKDKSTWRAEFFGPDLKVFLLRESSPLSLTGNHYQFVHRSILEYFFSRAIFDPDVLSATDATLSVVNSPLYSRNLTGESSVIQFLCDRVQQFPTFKQRLLTIIEQSKTDPNASQAAANAITILSRA
ncbi:WD_REPEATS_REGION domain-containing protein, partial [Mortierella sp. AD032]